LYCIVLVLTVTECVHHALITDIYCRTTFRLPSSGQRAWDKDIMFVKRRVDGR